jgi:hypothetical protein
MTEAERRYPPKKEGCLGTKKGDHGELPLEHPPVEKLSDPIHFVKNYKTALWDLAEMSMLKSETCKVDAVRLSRNMAYMLAQKAPSEKNGDISFEDFCKAGDASFEHHWNNHEFCGDWCAAKSYTEEEKQKFKNKYRNKETHLREYDQQHKVKSKFTEITRMKRIYHRWLNNKTESIHGVVVNVFLPKRSYFCRTICGKARTFLAVSVDSLGYYEYYRRLYRDVGIIMTTYTEAFYKEMDKRREHDKSYQKSEDFRKKRSQRKLDKITMEWKRDIVDKLAGTTYESGIAGPAGNDSKPTIAQAAKTNNKSTSFCNACKNYGHSRKSSFKCTKNPKNPYYVTPVLGTYSLY